MRKSNLTAQQIAELMLHYSSEIQKLSFLIEVNQEAMDELKKQLGKAPQEAAPATVTVEAKIADVKTPAAKTPKAKVEKKKAPGRPGRKKIEKPAEATTDAPKRGRGRPRKTEPTATAVDPSAPKRGRGRPKKEGTASPKPAKVKAIKEPAKKTGPKLRTIAEEEEKPKGYRLSDWDLFIINTLREANRALVKADFSDLAKDKIKREKLKMDEQTLQGKLTRSIHKLSNKRGDLIKSEYPGKGDAYGLPDWADENGKIRKEFTAHLNVK